MKDAISMNDNLTTYEKSPFDYMVSQELEKSKTLNEITSDISMITNLQNVKQGLKSDYSDEQITKLMFNDLKFTDDLIREHLDLLKVKSVNKKKKSPEHVPRDP